MALPEPMGDNGTVAANPSLSYALENVMKIPVLLAVAIVSALFLAPMSDGQLARSVDPLLGVSGGGNVFPGPVLPFGMIKPGPDMVAPEGHDGNAGWNAEGAIRGFSQTHVSGTGGGAKYGNILVQATTGAVAPLDSASPRAEEKASAGLYSVEAGPLWRGR